LQLTAKCHSGWTIIRSASVDQLGPLFKSYELHTQEGSNIYGPHIDSLSLAGQQDSDPTPEQSAFSGWVTTAVSDNFQFSISDDCEHVTGAASQSYYATGNYIHNPRRNGACQYYNRNCDMNSDDSCQTCRDNYSFAIGDTSRIVGGTCTHNIGGSADTYPIHSNNCHHWWNRFPVIPTKRVGVSNDEKFCIAFKEVDSPPDNYNTPAPTPMLDSAIPAMNSVLEFQDAQGDCVIGKNGDGSLYSTCDLTVRSHDRTYNVADELRKNSMITTSPGTVLQNGGEWMRGVGEYSTKHFYRHGANSGTHTTGSINLFEINNNYHWGGVHMDIEVWETYFTPGYRKYEYHNSGGTYSSGGALAQVSQTNVGGACTITKEYIGKVGFVSNSDNHMVRLKLNIPVYTMCFVKIKQTVGPSLTWYNDPNIDSNENTRYVKYMQKFSTKDDEDTVVIHGDGVSQNCHTDCA